MLMHSSLRTCRAMLFHGTCPLPAAPIHLHSCTCCSMSVLSYPRSQGDLARFKPSLVRADIPRDKAAGRATGILGLQLP